jgi:hypothetical protein
MQKTTDKTDNLIETILSTNEVVKIFLMKLEHTYHQNLLFTNAVKNGRTNENSRSMILSKENI